MNIKNMNMPIDQSSKFTKFPAICVVLVQLPTSSGVHWPIEDNKISIAANGIHLIYMIWLIRIESGFGIRPSPKFLLRYLEANNCF